MTPSEPTRKARRIEPWPVVVVCFLLLNVGICAVTIVAATRHPAIIEPNYYDKALRWDKLRELETEAGNARLVVRQSDQPGVISVSLTDAEGDVIQVKTISAVAVHVSNPAAEMRLGLQKQENGVFESSTPLRKPGVWTVVATVTMDDSLEPYTFTGEMMIDP